jgi:opacity protein-like surface antigen
MKRIAFGAVLALAGLSAGHAQQAASEVYQWKDASGVTHYSQTPPEKGDYTQRVIAQNGSAAPVAQTAASGTTGTTADAAGANPQCATAHKNIAALEGKAAVQQDTDGDGKPDKTLSDAERASQLEFAQAAVKAYCTP